MPAKLINRREPLLVIKPFKFWRREYNIGDILDRRRVKMRHRQVVRLISEGCMVLCKDLSAEELAEHGYIYDNRLGRYPLWTAEDHAKMTDYGIGEPPDVDSYEKLPEEEVYEEPLEDGDDDSGEATTKHIGGGWYDIMVEGKAINEKSMRKDDAIAFVEDYNGGE